MTEITMEQEGQHMTAIIGWFHENTEMRTVSPHEAQQSDCWLAVDEDEDVVGMALVETFDLPKTPMLHRIGVKSPRQREGIGRQMIRFLEAEYMTLQCQCRESNDANEFYEAVGWEQTGKRVGSPEDLYEWESAP